MAYQVLARKWRPKTFQEVVGQKHVLKALIHALDSNRLHHAYLFSGTRGVGKTTLGRIFAKSLNCERGVSANPCGQCSSCTEIDEGRFVDLLEVDAASRTKVDETRELLENVQYAPTRGRYKVYLIDEVHMLTTHSFNALLKTLEEPPPHVKFVLATTDPQKLPITILSRCLKFNLKAISADNISEHMRYILQQEKIDAESSALKLIARSATGSMRDALSLLDQAIAHGNGSVSDESVREMLGTIERKEIFRILKALVSNEPKNLLEEAQRLAADGVIFSSVLSELVSVLHMMAIAQVAPDVLEDSSEEIISLASQMDAEDIQLYYQIALMGQKDLLLAPDPRAGFEMTLLRMYAFKPDDSSATEQYIKVSQPKTTVAPAVPKGKPELTKLRSSMVTNERQPKQHSVSTAPANQGVQPWEAVVNQLPISGIVKQLAANSVFIGKENGVVSLKLNPVNTHLAGESIMNRLQQALSQHYQEEIKIRIVEEKVTEETPAIKEARQQEKALQDAITSMSSDPNIVAIEQTFNAKLDPNSVKLIDNE